MEVISQREKTGGPDSIICFLCSAISQPVPHSGETLTVSTFSDINVTELDEYKFLSPMNNDFLLEYVRKTIHIFQKPQNKSFKFIIYDVIMSKYKDFQITDRYL